MKLGTRSSVVASPLSDADQHADRQHQQHDRQHPALVLSDQVAGHDDLRGDDRPHREVELAGDDDEVLAHGGDRDRGGPAREPDQRAGVAEVGVGDDQRDDQHAHEDEDRAPGRAAAAASGGRAPWCSGAAGGGAVVVLIVPPGGRRRGRTVVRRAPVPVELAAGVDGDRQHDHEAADDVLEERVDLMTPITLSMTAKIATPAIVPVMLPLPPARTVPPRTTAAIDIRS